MSQIKNALGMISSPNYNLNQILQATQPPKQPGRFRQFLGAAVGAVGNMFAPGIGGMNGSAISHILVATNMAAAELAESAADSWATPPAISSYSSRWTRRQKLFRLLRR